MTPPPREQITGLVLAGGRGSRMGGVDKGLQHYHGQPLARHALRRLAPQVGELLVSATRHRDAYAAMGAVVVADTLADHPGPLAGLAAALAHCRTPFLASVPCDSPNFPLDLVSRLAAALAEDDAEIAMAASVEAGELRAQPVFCLLQSRLLPSLAAYLQGGQRKAQRWMSLHRRVLVPFDDASAFVNANTVAELQQLQQLQHPGAG
jgi:molybdopterin-guanine dinucleotide biosynthesis protein A